VGKGGAANLKGDHMSGGSKPTTDEMTTAPDETAAGLTPEELAAEGITTLPDKEVVSILDLNADLNLALDIAAPIDLAVAANANVAAPIDAAVGANVLSAGSTAQALSDQGAQITQGIVGDSTANAHQVSDIDQSNDIATTEVPAPTDTTVDVGDALSGPVLNIDVNLQADADLAAPIAGAVAANANVAAPIDAAVAANIGTLASEATAISHQDAIINQTVDGDATATADQDSDLTQ
jgi:hypothetical protein